MRHTTVYDAIQDQLARIIPSWYDASATDHERVDTVHLAMHEAVLAGIIIGASQFGELCPTTSTPLLTAPEPKQRSGQPALPIEEPSPSPLPAHSRNSSTETESASPSPQLNSRARRANRRQLRSEQAEPALAAAAGFVDRVVRIQETEDVNGQPQPIGPISTNSLAIQKRLKRVGLRQVKPLGGLPPYTHIAIVGDTNRPVLLQVR